MKRLIRLALLTVSLSCFEVVCIEPYAAVGIRGTVPQVCPASSEGVLLLWQSQAYIESSLIHHSAQSASVDVVSPLESFCSCPQMVSSENGAAFAVWSKARGVDAELAVAAFDTKSGWVAGEAYPIVGRVEGFNAACNAQGELVVAWKRRVGNDVRLEVVTYSMSAGWSSPKVVSEGDKRVQSVSVAVDGAGGVHAVWEEGEAPSRAVVACSRDRNGVWGEVLKLSDAESDAASPRVEMNDSGMAGAVWECGSAVMGTIKGPQGNWLNPVMLSHEEEQVSDLGLAINGAGDLAVVWKGLKGAQSAIRFNQKRHGEPWSEPVTLSSQNEYVSSPRLALSEEGSLFVVWKRAENGQAAVVGTWKSGSNVWNNPVSLSSQDGSVALPDVAITACGMGVVVWREGAAKDGTIRLAKVQVDSAAPVENKVDNDDTDADASEKEPDQAVDGDADTDVGEKEPNQAVDGDADTDVGENEPSHPLEGEKEDEEPDAEVSDEISFVHEQEPDDDTAPAPEQVVIDENLDAEVAPEFVEDEANALPQEEVEDEVAPSTEEEKGEPESASDEGDESPQEQEAEEVDPVPAPLPPCPAVSVAPQQVCVPVPCCRPVCRRWLFEGSLAYFRPQSKRLRDITDDAWVDPRLLLSYAWSPRFSVAGSVEYMEKTGHTPGSDDRTRMWLIPWTVTLRYHVFRCCRSEFYVGAGPRYVVFRNHNEAAYVKKHINDQSLGAYGEAGLFYHINECVLVDFFVGYSYNKLHSSSAGKNLESHDLELGGLHAGLGFGLKF